METIRKVISCEIKEIADRTLEFIGSTEEIDRDGEVIKASGWDLDNYNKNPVFMWAHRYDQPPIGKSIKTWARAGKLKFNIEFAPKETYEFADTIFKLYKGGFLKATSVGFVPDPEGIIEGDGEKTPKRTFTKQELLELSAVPIPSNPNALVQARDEGLITIKEFDSIIEIGAGVVTKPEETEDFIHIRVRDPADFQDGSFRTIDIDKGKGIKAVIGRLKGETTTTVQKYIFDKSKGWTMESAQAWVNEHKEIENIELKGAIPYHRTPLADEGSEWDAAREVRGAEVEDLKIMCAWVGDDPENKTAYKLPHHKASGDHACVWRAVAACGAVIMGARGGADIPESDMGGVKAHIGKHYADFDKGEPPWEKGVSQAEIIDELDYLIRLIDTEGMNDEVKKDAWNLVREVMRLSGGEIPVDIAEELGAALKKEPIEEPETVKPTLTREQILEIVSKTVIDVIQKAQGKVS